MLPEKLWVLLPEARTTVELLVGVERRTAALRSRVAARVAEGDAWRHTAPVAPYESRGFIGVNRGKRSISLDLEREEGREIARRLALGADVVAIAYRPGGAWGVAVTADGAYRRGAWRELDRRNFDFALGLELRVDL